MNLEIDEDFSWEEYALTCRSLGRMKEFKRTFNAYLYDLTQRDKREIWLYAIKIKGEIDSARIVDRVRSLRLKKEREMEERVNQKMAQFKLELVNEK